MSCCGGGGSAGNQAQSAVLIAAGVSAGQLMQLVYTCDDRRTRPFAIDGRIYQFGNNDRRRVNAVRAQLAPNFLDPAGRFYGCFEAFDASKHNADGSLLVPDDLTEIVGIGTAKEETLNNAGIHTFAQLAAQDAATVASLLGVSASQAQGMITQAANLA